MKKLFCLLFTFIALVSQARIITSTGNGGYWLTTSTWVGGVVPGNTDSAIIATTAGHQVTANGGTVLNVTINSGATLSFGSLTVKGLLTNNGSVTGISSGTLYFTLGSGIVVTGGGSWTSYVGYIYFQGANQVIDVSASICAEEIIMNTLNLAGNVKVTNHGTVTVSSTTYGGIINNDGAVYSSTWVNAANSTVSVTGASWGSVRDTLHASDSGNTVIYAGISAYNMKTPVNSTYYNITLTNSQVVNMVANYIANSVTVNSGAIFNMSGDSLFLTGSWTHPGTVINHKVIAVDTAVIEIGNTIVQKVPPTPLIITSVSAGGSWTSFTTWVSGIIPGVLDSAIINTTGTGQVYTLNSPTAYMIVNVTINSGAKLYVYQANLNVTGTLRNNGTITSGHDLIFTANTGTVITGAGSWSTFSNNIYFSGSDVVIDASAHVVAEEIFLLTTNHSVKVTNHGSVSLIANASYGRIINSGATNPSVWVNAANAYTGVSVASWTQSIDSLHASDSGNVVEYGGITALNLKKPVGGNYYNLTISGTNTISLPGDITVNNNLNITNGTLACGTHQISGNTSGILSVSSGASLTLGLTTSATVPTFPTNFTTAHITLNPNSTVIYQGNAAQTISTTPATYGHLTLSTGTSASTKTAASTSLTVAGNLTINSTVTLGGLSSGGTLNVGGNFTNNGIYTQGTSTVTLTGTSGQTLGGSSTTTFYNLTVNGATGNVVTLGNNQSVTQNLNLSSGSLNTSTYHIN